MKQGRCRGWVRVMLPVLMLSIGCHITASAQGVFADMQPGSYLVFPVFDIHKSNKTEFWITNTDPGAAVRIQLRLVCPGSDEKPLCPALGRLLTLAPNGSVTLDVADLQPPCREGFAVAVAVNKHQQAISFNALIGSYHILKPVGNNTVLDGTPAMAIQSVRPLGTNLAPGGLRFGPQPQAAQQDYAALGSQLFTAFQAVAPKRKRGSQLILLTLNHLPGAHNPTSLVMIDFWNANKIAFSTSWTYVCWTRVRLDKIDRNFLQRHLETPTGFLTVSPIPTCPLPGGCPPLRRVDPAVLGAIGVYAPGYEGKRNLHHDNVATSTTYAAH